MIIIDTTVWIDYFNGAQTWQTDWLDAEIARQRLGLTDLILCEILQGVKDEGQAAETLRELLKFEIFPMGGIDLATASAQNYRALRTR